MGGWPVKYVIWGLANIEQGIKILAASHELGVDCLSQTDISHTNRGIFFLELEDLTLDRSTYYGICCIYLASATEWTYGVRGGKIIILPLVGSIGIEEVFHCAIKAVHVIRCHCDSL